jgi:hypothetical protein
MTDGAARAAPCLMRMSADTGNRITEHTLRYISNRMT